MGRIFGTGVGRTRSAMRLGQSSRLIFGADWQLFKPRGRVFTSNLAAKVHALLAPASVIVGCRLLASSWPNRSRRVCTRDIDRAHFDRARAAKLEVDIKTIEMSSPAAVV